jgi:hypothetical protein
MHLPFFKSNPGEASENHNNVDLRASAEEKASAPTHAADEKETSKATAIETSNAMADDRFEGISNQCAYFYSLLVSIP